MTVCSVYYVVCVWQMMTSIVHIFIAITRSTPKTVNALTAVNISRIVAICVHIWTRINASDLHHYIAERPVGCYIVVYVLVM